MNNDDGKRKSWYGPGGKITIKTAGYEDNKVRKEEDNEQGFQTQGTRR